MGTDIHLFVEVKRAGVWERVNPARPMDEWIAKIAAENPENSYYATRARVLWHDTRNYSAFAILANVRNGRGFGGVLTGDGFNYISEPRGLPADLSTGVREALDSDDESDDLCIGDHSISWLTLAELDAFDWQQTTRQCGVITAGEYLARLERGDAGRPKDYCGDVMGDGIVIIDEPTANYIATNGMAWPARRTHVRVWWNIKYADAAGDFYRNLLPELRKLGKPEDVRIVFGFDS